MFISAINRRHCRFQAAWLLIALSLSIGCRSMQPKPESAFYPVPAPEFSPGGTLTSQPPPLILGNSTSPGTPLPVTVTEEKIQAFRPISPETIASKPLPAPSPVPSASPAPLPPVAPSPVAPPPSVSQDKIDELNKRIANLERSLVENEKKLLEARLSAPVAEPAQSAPTQSEPKPAITTTVEKPAAPLPVPALNIPGISASSDAKRVRIEIPDSALYISGTWQLSPEGEESLRKIVAEIRAKWPQATLDIEGHTDNINLDPKNATQKHDLSSYKATVVMQYFVKMLLWNPAKITTSGHGSSRPAADNGTPEGRARNNRIEIVIQP